MKSTQSIWVLLLICLLMVLLCQMCCCQHHTTGRDRHVGNRANKWKSGKRTHPSTETQETLMKVRRAESARFLAKLVYVELRFIKIKLKDYAEKVMHNSESDYIQRHYAGDIVNEEYNSGMNPRWYEG